MNVRFINCEACQTEGRLLTNDGGPDDVDHGPCPECKGERVVEVEVQPITIDDRPFYGAECPSYPNCAGGCDLGCTHEIEARRSVSLSNGDR